MKKERYEILKRLHEADGGLAYMLAVFGDTLAKREGYKELEGMEAVYFYIVHKFKWPPAQVRGMSASDLRFILTEEMSGWKAPVAAR
ncbi:hypothetical protein [Burkholderia thailandensis]|uniref:hypothetical protein n=1 Tax=Burkholderia thailandensis TaxID=57975 RepID=UPI00148EA816|nr:hypothetical protein [Burkholderia thailandensis]NOK56666.1 hypothetical protein [Burkholderia thailandensis]